VSDTSLRFLTLSFVIPAYNASRTIDMTLRSVYDASASGLWNVEVIVIDDGSTDRDALHGAVSRYPQAIVVNHATNRGMCASRNSGIQRSRGDLIVILDADDELVPGWPAVLRSIVDEWPPEAQVCFSACRTPSGRSTVSDPDYGGFLTEGDLLNERHRGEYLPLFRGSYIRSRRYVDIGTRRSCGILSYLTFSRETPLWVTPRVLRIYHDESDGSVSRGWATPAKAREAVRCYGALLELFAEAYRQSAPRVYRTKLLRLAVYRHLAGEPNAWGAWWAGATGRTLPETVATAILLLLSPGWCSRIVTRVRQSGLVHRYG
jgi:glycosyltransferase involved in cell wall biosynthesis